MRLEKDFFARDALTVAPELVGKTLVRVMPDGEIRKLVISETEAYMGEKDTACHAQSAMLPSTWPAEYFISTSVMVYTGC